MRDQPLDWQTAPPVHVLKYLVLGGKKDASSREVGSLYSTCACVEVPVLGGKKDASSREVGSLYSTCACVEVPGARRQEGCLEQGGR